MRWRNPDWYAELHRRARHYYVMRLPRTSGLTQQHVLFDLIFLHRDNAAVRPFFGWQTSGALTLEPFAEGDREVVLAMVGQHEGPKSAQTAAHWLSCQPHSAWVARDATDRVVGFTLQLALHTLAPADRESDPATDCAWRYLQQCAPLRAGEGATHFRYWMAHDTYQSVSPIQSLLFVNAVKHYLTTPGLAFHFFPCAEPDLYAGVLAYADLVRLPEADYTMEGRRYGVFGHDWRVTPPAAWLALLAERETTQGAVAAPAAQAAVKLIVLSEADFVQAVRAVLQDFTQPDMLRENPLLRSRLALDRAGPASDEAARTAALLAIIAEAAQALLASPREVKFHRVLEVTYFKPIGTQELAAERLDLPFSTFRRYLKSGLARLTDLLWQKEIG